MFSITIPPRDGVKDENGDKDRNSFQRKIELRATDEAGNNASYTFVWWQTSLRDDPNPKRPGTIFYEYIDECTIQVNWKSAAAKSKLGAPSGIPESKNHLIWWAHKNANQLLAMKTADVVRLREQENNTLHALWKNNTDVDYNVKKGRFGRVEDATRMNVWSATLPLIEETIFNITLENPAYDNRTFFGVSAIPKNSLIPQVQTSIIGWTIAEDCRDSAYYLDVSGDMSCPGIEREDGSYRPDTDCESNKWRCVDCVDGGDCRGAVVWPNIGVKNGWWRASWNNSIILPCDQSMACQGALGDTANERRCNSTNPAPLGTCNEDEGYTALCAKAFNEWKLVQPDIFSTPVPELQQCNMCTRCLQNETHLYGRSFGSTSKCDLCWSHLEHALIAAVLILLFCSTIGWYIRANRKTGYRSNVSLFRQAVSLTNKSSGVVVERLDERAKYKLAMVATANKCIIILCYSGSLTIPWHPVVKYMFIVYKAMTTFVGDYIRLDCLSAFKYEETFPFIFKDALFWVITFPSILALFTLLALLCSRTNKTRKINAVAAAMATIETLYPTICAKIFSLFACKWIGERRFMVYDLDVECYLDDRYNVYVYMLAIPAVILFIVGIPVLSGVFVWSQRRKTHSNIVGRVIYRLMTVGLRPSHYLWRSMEKVRCSVVVFVLVYTSQYGPFIHVFAYVGILTITHLCEVLADPYRMIRVKAHITDHLEDEAHGIHNRSDEEFQNVFQKMKNYAMMVALGTIFLGSLQLGADTHQQWRQNWWIDWDTLNDVVAVIVVVFNVCFVYWLLSTVSTQFRIINCCSCCSKKKKKKKAAITPELAKRRDSAAKKVLRSLSSTSVGKNASKLTAWKENEIDHDAASKRLMSLASNSGNMPAPLTSVVPKPSEEIVIQRVVEAGHEFVNTTVKRKKDASDTQRLKLLQLAKQARVRVRRKKTKTLKVKRRMSGADGSMFASPSTESKADVVESKTGEESKGEKVGKVEKEVKEGKEVEEVKEVKEVKVQEPKKMEAARKVEQVKPAKEVKVEEVKKDTKQAQVEVKKGEEVKKVEVNDGKLEKEINQVEDVKKESTKGEGDIKKKRKKRPKRPQKEEENVKSTESTTKLKEEEKASRENGGALKRVASQKKKIDIKKASRENL